MSDFDDFLSIGAGFDWITPLSSIIRTATTDAQTFSTPAEYIGHVRQAAQVCGVRLRGESLSPDGDLFLFDVTPDEWAHMADWLGW